MLDERYVVTSGLENWSVNWSVPAEGDQQQADIVATAYAGEASVTDRIQVTIDRRTCCGVATLPKSSFQIQKSGLGRC